jgi:hypothetical protein
MSVLTSEGRAGCDGKGAARQPSRWDEPEKAGIGDASQLGECQPHRGVHGRIASALAQREGRAGYWYR